MLISSLHVYPIKSAAGMSVDSWELGDFGLLHDREFMVVDDSGTFLTQRQSPALALVRPELGEPMIVHTPEGRATVVIGQEQEVRVWSYSGPALDCGDEVADLLTSWLGQTCRLVRMPPQHTRTTPAGGHVGFADGYPLLITSEASLVDLNSRLGEPLPMDRFRPNVVVVGSEPWAEDSWLELDIAGVRVDLVKPCARCAITRVDQRSGVRDGLEPLRTLATFRLGAQGVEFGHNAVHRARGTWRVGDQVTVTRQR